MNAARERVSSVEVSGASLFVTERGTGEPAVLLVHGWSAEGSDWSWQAAALAQRHRVMVPDLRGFGRSTATPTGYPPRELAADLAVLLDGLGVTGVIAVGHSMGAVVVSALAVEHPELVSSVVVADPAYGVPEDEWPERLELLSSVRSRGSLAAAEAVRSWAGPRTPEWLVEWHARRALGGDPAVLEACLAGLFEAPDEICSRAAGEAYLARRTQPVLAVHTTADAAQWERGLWTNPRSRAVVWEDVGHWVQIERAAEFTRLLIDWVDGADGVGP